MVKEIWRLIAPRKFVFPEGFAWGKFDCSFENKSLYVYFPNIHAIHDLFYRTTYDFTKYAHSYGVFDF